MDMVLDPRPAPGPQPRAPHSALRTSALESKNPQPGKVTRTQKAWHFSRIPREGSCAGVSDFLVRCYIRLGKYSPGKSNKKAGHRPPKAKSPARATTRLTTRHPQATPTGHAVKSRAHATFRYFTTRTESRDERFIAQVAIGVMTQHTHSSGVFPRCCNQSDAANTHEMATGELERRASTDLHCRMHSKVVDVRGRGLGRQIVRCYRLLFPVLWIVEGGAGAGGIPARAVRHET